MTGWNCDAEISREATTLLAYKEVAHVFKTNIPKAKGLYMTALMRNQSCDAIYGKCDKCPLNVGTPRICDVLMISEKTLATLGLLT